MVYVCVHVAHSGEHSGALAALSLPDPLLPRPGLKQPTKRNRDAVLTQLSNAHYQAYCMRSQQLR